MSARTHVADLLTDADFVVVPAPVDLDGITGTTLVVYREDVKPGVTPGFHENTVAVWVLDPRQDPRAAEDYLDASLSSVLDALDGDTALTWTAAERGTYQDVWPAYKISVSVTTSKE